jgi:hypothetical protein
MRSETQKGCGCGWIGLLAFISLGLIGGVLFLLNQYFVIVPREAVSTPTNRQSDQAALFSTPAPKPMAPATPEATPAPAVDLIELESRMQDWPEEVTLERSATFPGELVASAGTKVKLISAGPEVEIEYLGEQAKILANQTDLVARVLSHRAQVAKELSIDRQIAGLRTAREQNQEVAKNQELERVHGKTPTHEDAYFATKTYLKQLMKVPDSLEIISVSQVAPSDYNGKKCWATKVQFRTRDEIGVGVLESGVIYLSGDQVLGYEKAE